MRKTSVIMVCWILFQCLWAQADSTRHAAAVEELKLNPGFLKALDRAFEIAPETEELPRENELTREQLHEWVGRTRDDTASMRQRRKFTREYFAYKCYLKEFCTLPKDSIRIHITGLSPARSILSTGKWDFNHGLSMLLSKKYRQRAKSQQLAASHRKEMDLLFPLAEGEEIRPSDTGARSTWEAPDWLKGLTK